MNPFDYTKAFTDFWSAQGKAMIDAQEQAGRALADGMQAMANGTMPDLANGSTDLSGTATDMARASQAMMQLWSAATEMSRVLAAKLPAADGDATIESVLGRIADPRQWLSGTGEMDDALGRMAEGPRLADLWEVERRYGRVLQAWMLVRRRGLEHNAVVLQAWLQAARRFAEDLAARPGAETPTAEAKAPDAKAMLALWTETANRQLLETQRSEAFLTSQRDMIRASTDLRMAQQELVEHFGKQYGFPTRTELDDVHRTVTELRREMRLLRRQQRVVTAPTPAPAQNTGAESGAAGATARRTANKQRRAR